VGEISFWYRPTRVVPDQRPLNGRCISTNINFLGLIAMLSIQCDVIIDGARPVSLLVMTVSPAWQSYVRWGPSQEGALFGGHTSSCPRRMYPVLFARGSTWNAAFHCHYCSSLFYAVIYIRRQMKWTLTKARRVITQTRSLRKSCLRKLMPCQNLPRRNHSENSDSTCQYLQCEMR